MAVLQVLKGLNPGQQFPIEAECTILGRHPDCDVVLDVGAVSRQHAQIIREGDDFFAEDLKSRNGTFVNGELVSGRQRLADKDRVKICDLLFTFHRELPTGSSVTLDTPALMVDDDELTSSSTIMSKLDLSADESGLRVAVKPEAKLRAMMEISQSLSQALSVDEVLPKILDGLFKIFAQADRGFVVLRATPDGPLIPKAVKHRRAGEEDTARISRTIVQTAMDSKQAMLSADAASDSRFDMSQSISDFQIRSMMCVPLLNSSGAALGVIQIDTTNQHGRFGQDDLDVLASVAGQAAVAVENAQLLERTLAQQAIERDLELAHKVQQGFLPANRPDFEGYEFFDFYEPARWLGGDFYDYVELPSNRLAVVLADVSGKGTPAALLVAKLSAEMRFALASEDQLATAIRRINAEFAKSGWEDRFVTLVVALIDVEQQTMTIVNAGHLPPYLRNRKGEIEAVAEEETGLPLGVDADYPYEQMSVPLAAGDSILLYTDGISEAMNADGDLFGFDRLRETLSGKAQKPPELGQNLLDDVKSFVGDQPQSDDMCLVCFGRV